jgi:hypothetical protein
VLKSRESQNGEPMVKGIAAQTISVDDSKARANP